MKKKNCKWAFKWKIFIDSACQVFVLINKHQQKQDQLKHKEK